MGFQEFLQKLTALLSARPSLERKRARLLQEPFPAAWDECLQRNVAIYSFLAPEKQERLCELLHIFVAERRWEGCGGQTITDEIKVTIGALACILLLGMEHDYFSQVPSILVYPTAFMAGEAHPIRAGVIHEEGVGLVGEAWRHGPVILAWDNVLADARTTGIGRNLVFHEFAHQIDFQGEWPHRATRAEMRSLSRRWNKVMTAEYEKLIQDAEEGRATLLDEYGATDPAEFFAVATECFFEQPARLRRRHPRLYSLLRDFYGQDPATEYAN